MEIKSEVLRAMKEIAKSNENKKSNKPQPFEFKGFKFFVESDGLISVKNKEGNEIRMTGQQIKRMKLLSDNQLLLAALSPLQTFVSQTRQSFENFYTRMENGSVEIELKRTSMGEPIDKITLPKNAINALYNYYRRKAKVCRHIIALDRELVKR